MNEATPKDPWIFVKLLVSSFTCDEWPERELAASESFSIGEEQSNSTVTWLAWSPLRLAKHKRSVLAVLTSNHLLSLWAPDGDMGNEQSWNRVCVVNDAFQIAFQKDKFRSRIENIRSQGLRRVRSVAWAPSLNVDGVEHRHANSEIDSIEHDYGAGINVNGDQASVNCTTQRSASHHLLPTNYQLLAAANDLGGIYFLNLSSPFMNGSNGWEIEMLEMVALPNQDDMISDIEHDIPDDGFLSRHNPAILDSGNQNSQKALSVRPSLLAFALAKKSFVEDVLWSNWKPGTLQREERSVLTVRRSGVVSHLVIAINCSQGSVRCDLSKLLTKKRDLLERAQRSMLWSNGVSVLTCHTCVADIYSRRKTILCWPASVGIASILARGITKLSNIKL